MQLFRRRFAQAVPFLMGLILLSCGGSEGTAPPDPDEPYPSSVTISPSAATLRALGATTQFAATVRDQRGREMGGYTVTWNSSEASVASVNSSGLATALADGSTTIIAVATSSVSGWAALAVEAVDLEITTGATPVGVLGDPYTLQLEAVGVSSPAWALSSGTLPVGLELNPTSGAITGTPTELGKKIFTVQLSSGGQTTTREISITIISGDLGIGFGEDQFSLIPAGSFQMGSAGGPGDEEPVHTVQITQPYFIQKTEVTQGQWRSIMGTSPSAFGDCGDTCPVERVSWDDIQAFLLALNLANPGANFRLPTEAEWEYAARAGTLGDYGGSGELDQMGWYSDNSGRKTQFVGLKASNAWGLFDMHGNVYEWVQDWYAADYYSVSPENDPLGPPEGTMRVLRGGSVDQSGSAARSANRYQSLPFRVGFTIYFGFRLVRVP